MDTIESQAEVGRSVDDMILRGQFIRTARGEFFVAGHIC